ncbi:MAG: hypothetical protein RL635_537 [Chloroflexota bacterium]|jgi:uncharacterized membrane protein
MALEIAVVVVALALAFMVLRLFRRLLVLVLAGLAVLAAVLYLRHM